MGAMASQITSPASIYSTFNWDADQREHESAVSLACVPGTGEFPAHWPVTRKMFPFHDVIMIFLTEIQFKSDTALNPSLKPPI